ncbi:MAG: pirin family protein [Bacteroidota bacterium]
MRTIKFISPSEHVKMGGSIIKQPLPTKKIEQFSPFLLLHHFGPDTVQAGQDPLGVGPHPHRGFEPVTFLYSGGIRHKDSHGNEGILEGGDVQWMTAGKGIIHSELASKDFLEKGGTMEGIQLWVNLSKANKMVPARYQDIKNADIPRLSNVEEGVEVKLVAGDYDGLAGTVETNSPILAMQIEMQADKVLELTIPTDYNAMAYVLSGSLNVNDDQDIKGHTLVGFEDDNEIIKLRSLDESRILLLAGEPINEPVVQWGPYVMNSQTEILQAMRDYQMGKMGVYID